MYLSSFHDIDSLCDGVLEIDICSLSGFLNPFEIGELFCYIVGKYIDQKDNITEIKFTGSCSVPSYLHRINMIGCLNRIFDISLGSTSYFLGNNANLDELELFTTEADFENRIISYHQKLISLGINPMTAGKIKTVLSELSRNTFEHNFGKRGTTGPLMVNMIHHQVSQKKLLFSLFDIGVGCSGTLGYKFPGLTEYEYICKAMTEGVTCREDDSNGGLGLPYLKKVVFREDKNYPDPEIIFRSNATTIEFDAEENILLKDEVKQAIISGVHVYFVISY